MCVRLCSNSERESDRVWVCVGVPGSSILCSRREKRCNHSISERGRETGMLGESRGSSKRDEGKEGREDGTQLTWPITANEVRYKQRERQGGSMSVEDMDTMTRTRDGRREER